MRSPSDFTQVYVWSVPAHGALKRNFFCNGWGDSYNQCYADAPFDEGRECYGFLVNRPFRRPDSRSISMVSTLILTGLRSVLENRSMSICAACRPIWSSLSVASCRFSSRPP